MKHYPHHIGDFDKATRHLTRLERSVYRDLIDLYYDTEQRLMLDQAALCRRIIARSNEESTAVEQVLSEFFTETTTGWYHDRCEAEIEAYRNNNSQKAQAGKASAEAKRLRKLQALNETQTAVQHPLESVGTESNGTPTNHQPSTNQPSTKEEPPRKRSASPVFELPDWINREHWDAWHSCAKRRKASAEQKALAVAKLEAWRKAGLDHAGALENAAVGGWQGLFLPDAQKPANSSFAQQAADIARTTVPSRPDKDPVLLEIEAHANKAAPIPQAIREKINALKGTVIQ
jgi:uncharacterized protein YdaU (DUF1376 family)